ncbi:DUF4974 domain-containing protein [Sphingobacterium olei]|uniref:DUF4974 domain-containing protein n=1 Tax=Sphingobacterium olei TaxID=2571155 RepID=A0A4V6WHP7_9SPHI|nr:FecR domain-containing protein [Sphingobacterium olei]TJZ54768.1 DUF4974 domain-containing protein [Sphingobacterium olei]
MKVYRSTSDFLMDESFCRCFLQHSEEDVLKWKKYTEEHPEKRELIEKSKQELLELYEALANVDTEENFDKLRQQLPARTTGLGNRRYYYVAASIALFLVAAASIWFYIIHPKGSIVELQYVTQPSERKSILLADGTRVKLNADSRLEVARGFGNTNRSIKLVGEAYLEVAKNPDLPFTIITNTLDVRVLGTTLNIRAYPNEDITSASLIEGSAEVLLKNTEESPIRLKPLEKVVAAAENKQLEISNSDPQNISMPEYTLESVTQYDAEQRLAETSWTEQKLVFVNEPLSSISKTLERWYDIKIVFLNDEIKSRKYTAAFDEKESLQNVLEMLRASIPFRYGKAGARVITITSQ